jgi:hypothetical protein
MSNLANMFGNSYQVFDDDENLVSVGTSLEFWDDDPFALYVEQVGSRIRIFDDGLVVTHMLGSGLEYFNENLMQSIANIAKPEGVLLNDDEDFEIWAEASEISDAFAHYMSAMVALLKWEAVEVERISTPASIKLPIARER